MKRQSSKQKIKSLQLKFYREKKSKTRSFVRFQNKNIRLAMPVHRPITRKMPNNIRKGIIRLPKILSFRDNPDETINCLHSMMRKISASRGNVYFDFESINFIEPAASLVLVSEINRWSHFFKKRPFVPNLSKWEPTVANTLGQMGMFDFLLIDNIKDAQDQFSSPMNGETFIKFKSGTNIQGEVAKTLRENIEFVLGESFNKKSMLFRAITEAMANVSHHAYPRGYPFKMRTMRNRWWLTGYHSTNKNSINVIFYDQGVGIPTSLGLKYTTEKIFDAINNTFTKYDLPKIFNMDPHLIKAAFEIGRSGTEMKHRGKGLNDLREIIANRIGGSLRILSGKGGYEYYFDHNRTEWVEKLISFPLPVGGTLIDWHIAL